MGSDLNDWKSRLDCETQLITKALQDPAFKEELIRNTRKVIAKEFCTQLPGTLEIRVLEETEKVLYIVLPYVADTMTYDKDSQQPVFNSAPNYDSVESR